MLPKRSTPVEQNFSSENTHSQLSVAIFIASRNLLGALESLIYKKKCQNGKTQKQPPLWSYFCAICSVEIVVIALDRVDGTIF